MEDTLTKFGLNKTQAQTYMLLIKGGPQSPPEIARHAKITRTNAYKVLDSLVDLGIVRKNGADKKLIYSAENPVKLETLAVARRNEALRQETMLQANLPALLTYFFSYSNQPGIRFFQGKEGIKQIFADMLRTKQDIYLIRSPADNIFYNESFYADFRRKRAQAGITTYALTIKDPARHYDQATDRLNKFQRTWLPMAAYTASVEWDIYGDKTAIISYGDEAIGLIIESPQIAESLRQLFTLVQAGQQTAIPTS